VLILAMAAVSYQNGMASKRRPIEGYLQVNQEAMMEVKKMISGPKISLRQD
jgi:hypothetical protein